MIGDFETRSAVDLKAVGAYEYAKHPTTEVMAFAWALDDEEDVGIWHPAFRDWTDIYAKRKVDRIRRDIPEAEEPTSLFAALCLGEKLEAHNAFFEKCIWHFQMVAKYGWPALDHDRFVCTQALVASYGLRQKLDHAVKDLGLSEEKDSQGYKIMKSHCVPRKVNKAERRVIFALNDLGGEFEDWKWGTTKTQNAYQFEAEGHAVPDTIARFKQERADLEHLFEYCKQDVRSERGLARTLRPLPEIEQKTFTLDQEINWRGLHIDREMINAAIKIGEACDADSQQELGDITHGQVIKASQRVQMKAWLHEQGVEIPTKLNKHGETKETTESAAMQTILDRDDPAEAVHVRRACEIWIAVNKTSTKKYYAIRNRVSAEDDRVRATLRYHAASTGRWGGSGIQPHNFPRKCPKDDKGAPAGSGMELAVEQIKTGDYELICMLHGRDKVMTFLSSALRGTVTPAAGNELLASDYSSVEARGTFWISEHEEGIEAFRQIDSGAWPNQDIYTWQASEIFNRLITKDDDDERQSGKVVILGAGYQMSGKKLVSYAAKMGIELEDDRADELIEHYRDKNWPVVEFWGAAQKCAMKAVRHPGLQINQGPHIKWKVHGRFLHCRLPSGRFLSYLDPKVERVEMPWGMTTQTTFMGVDTYTRQFKRTSTYGGKLTENIVQAICRDIMRDAMHRAEAAGYTIVLTVHDEIVSEVLKGFGSVEEFNAILSVVPEWAPGFPVIAEGWRATRYRK